VRAPAGSSPLVAALDELSGLAGDDDRAALDALRGRLAGQRLRVLVAGEAKRGKSTLVNALLGRAVLPVGVTPLTALATTVRYGRDEGVSTVFRDGRVESFPLSALGDLVTERGNPGNRRNLASVTVVADAPVLARGAELVDTPGTGSVYARGTAEAEAALGAMDAAVFVLTADPPVSASERELMARVAELSVTMFVVLNKADHLTGGELAEALEFTAQVAAGATGRPVRLYPLSARAALADGGDPGFAAFAADFTTYLTRGRAADLQASVAAHARRLAVSLHDEATLARHAAQMRTGAAAGRVEEFAARLAAVRERRQAGPAKNDQRPTSRARSRPRIRSAYTKVSNLAPAGMLASGARLCSSASTDTVSRRPKADRAASATGAGTGREGDSAHRATCCRQDPSVSPARASPPSFTSAGWWPGKDISASRTASGSPRRPANSPPSAAPGKRSAPASCAAPTRANSPAGAGPRPASSPATCTSTGPPSNDGASRQSPCAVGGWMPSAPASLSMAAA